jgi:hypothetical protein
MFALGIDLGTRTQSNQGIRNGLPGTNKHALAKFAVRGQKRKFPKCGQLGASGDVYHGGHATGGTADRVDRVLRHLFVELGCECVLCAESCCRGRASSGGVDIGRRGLRRNSGEISLERANGVNRGRRTEALLMPSLPCDIPDGNCRRFFG